jgi:hypothetical protein
LVSSLTLLVIVVMMNKRTARFMLVLLTRMRVRMHTSHPKATTTRGLTEPTQVFFRLFPSFLLVIPGIPRWIIIGWR